MSQPLAVTIRHQYGSLAELKSEFSAAALGMFTSGWVWFVTDKSGNTGILPTYGPGTLLIRSRTYLAHAKGPSLSDVIANAEVDGQRVEHELEYESGEKLNISSSPARSPTTQPSPPGVSPSSPTSGVRGSKDPSGTSPLHPRFYSTSLLGAPASIYSQPNVEEPVSKVDLLNIGDVLYPLFCISVNEHAWMAAGYGVWGKEEWLKKFWTVLDWEKVSKAYDGVRGKKR